MNDPGKRKIGVVGPCAAGKSTLAEGLGERGYEVRHIAQEHSYVKDMWFQISNPDALIYLDVSHPVSLDRRPQNFTMEDFNKQVGRLAHARKHADYYINTDPLSIPVVLESVCSFLDNNLPK